VNLPAPIDLLARLPRRLDRPVKQHFGNSTVILSSTVVLQDRVYPRVWSKRSLHPVGEGSITSANYTTIVQSRDQVMVPASSPSVSMWPYLVTSAQTERLPQISVYAHRGTSRDQARFLYMNAGALALWKEMGMPGTVIGESHRPPWNAALSFGMPFSE